MPLSLPLAGAFQASNALVAAGLAIGLGENADAVFAALEHLKGAPGRLEKVAFAEIRRAHLCRLRPHAGCAGKCADGFAPAHQGQAACGVRLRRRPRQGQAAADGCRRGATGRPRDRHRRQSPHAKMPPPSAAKFLAAAPGRARSAIAPRPSAPALPRWAKATCWSSPAKVTRAARSSATTVHPFSDRDEAIKAARRAWRPGAQSMSRCGPPRKPKRATLGQASRPSP